MILRVAGIMALGMSLAFSAHAGRGINRATGQAIWDAAVHGRTTTIGGGNNSMQIIRPTTQGTPVRQAGGGATVTDTIPAPVGGATVPVAVTTNVGKEAIVGAAVGLATGGLLGGVLGAGAPLLLDWMNNSKLRIGPTGAMEHADPKACTMAPCFEYGIGGQIGYFRSMEAACAAGAEYQTANSNPPGYVFTVKSISGNTCLYAVKRPNGTDADDTPQAMGTRSAEPQSSTWYTSTSQEWKDALYNNDPPPGVIDELSKYGNIIWPGPSSVSGPAEVTGPMTTSISNSGNQSTTTTSQTSTPLTYNGSSVTAGNPTTNSTTTTTTTNADGSTSTSTSTTTTTTEPGTAEETPAEEVAPTDTALPPVPDLYTRKYPNGMEGIWNDYKDQLKGTDLVSLVGKLMPNVNDGGSCPTWPINLELAQWASYGTHDVAPPCWIWDVAKAILILSALLLARALVFGG